MKSKRMLLILTILLMTVMSLGLSGMALAQDENGTSDNATTPPPVTATVTTTVTTTPTTTTPPPPTLALSTEFPAVEAIATGTFAFTVKLDYSGDTDRVFDLNVAAPARWDAYVTPQYDSQRISSISMDASSSYSPTSKTVKLTATPQVFPLPDPGDYQITLEVTSGEVVGSLDLTARITAKYVLDAVPSIQQRYNTTAAAGQDNVYSIIVRNMGTAPIDNITFSSEKPDGWEITFEPDKIDSLDAQNTVDVNIKPPPKTVSGDYIITLHVSGTQATADQMDVRVTVETPTIWGWVGVIIIVLVVAGLIFIFMRFGRR
jgi:uncharacterized repeat protein (TIGR01451 family)